MGCVEEDLIIKKSMGEFSHALSSFLGLLSLLSQQGNQPKEAKYYPYYYWFKSEQEDDC